MDPLEIIPCWNTERWTKGKLEAADEIFSPDHTPAWVEIEKSGTLASRSYFL